MLEPVTFKIPALTCPYCGITVTADGREKLNECCPRRAKEMLLFLVANIKRDPRHATAATRQDVKSLRAFLKSQGIGIEDYKPEARQILKGVL